MIYCQCWPQASHALPTPLFYPKFHPKLTLHIPPLPSKSSLTQIHILIPSPLLLPSASSNNATWPTATCLGLLDMLSFLPHQMCPWHPFNIQRHLQKSREWRVESGEWRAESGEWRATSRRQLTTSHVIRSFVQTNTVCQLQILQWNADFLPAEVTELLDFLKHKTNAAMIQETKVYDEDPTPLIERYDHIRQDGQGSCVTYHRGRWPGDISGKMDKVAVWLIIEVGGLVTYPARWTR